MTTAYSNLLGLALPVTGELSGTWGDTVNDYITKYLDDAIANAQVISGSQTAVTLSKTTGTALVAAGSGSTGSAQYALIRCTGNPASTLTITVSYSSLTNSQFSKTYLIFNSTSTNQSVVVQATTSSGTSTGVTITAGERALIAWNGTDFVKIATQSGTGEFVTVDTTNLEVTNIKAKDGTAAATIADSTGAITVSTLLNVDNLRLDGNTLSSTDSNGNVVLAPNGTGDVQLDADTVRIGDSNANATITTNGTGDLILNTNSGTNSGSITIEDGVNGNIIIAPNGTGQVQITNAALDLTTIEVTNIRAKDGTAAMTIADSTGAVTVSTLLNVDNLRLDGNTLSSTNTNGAINLTPNGTGQVTITNDALINSLTVGRGAGALSQNTALGISALGGAVTGNFNTALGWNALLTNTGGQLNTAVGNSALGLNTTGSSNNALGQGALYYNTTGGNNTAVGHNALISNTTASGNTAIGFQAGYSNTTGTDNISIGRSAGYGITTTSNNIAVGYNTLSQGAGAANSVAIGHEAQRYVGSNVVAVGHQALTSSTASNNTAVGYWALYTNTTGTNNTALGQAALVFNTTSSQNVAVGTESLRSNTTGGNNTAVGYQSGYSNTTGTNGAVLGYQALYSNTTGTRNTAIGNAALYNNIGANDNTAVGANALPANTSGANNVAVGSSALQSNTTASNNTAVGYQAGYSNTTGAQNTNFGAFAGYSRTTGGYNLMVGMNAGYYGTTGVGNTFVGQRSDGAGAGQEVTTGSKNVILGGYNGNSGGLDIRTANNYIVLSDGDGNPRQYWNGTVWTLGSARRTVVGDAFVGDNSSNGNDRSIIFGSGGLIPGTGSGTSSDAAYDLGIAGNRWAVARVTGVNFPATQVASSDANTLDDYEEGDFTPTYFGSTSAGTTTYTEQIGRYTKIGRQVTVNFSVGVSNATGTGDIRIGGMPFTSTSAIGVVGTLMASNLTWTGDYLSSYLDGGAVAARIYRTTAGAGLNDVPIDTACNLYGTITYIV